MIRVAFGILAVMLSLTSAAETFSAVNTINRVRLNRDIVYFGVTPQPANTCSAYGEYFRFNITTEQGKAMYAMLLAAKSQKINIEIWYSESSAPGTNQNTGCDFSSLSLLTGIGIR